MVTFTEEMVERRIEPAVHRLGLVFNNVFKTQCAAQLLSESLSKIDDDVIRRLEQDVCDFTLNPEGVDVARLKSDLAAKLNCANDVIRNYDAYEKAARVT